MKGTAAGKRWGRAPPLVDCGFYKRIRLLRTDEHSQQNGEIQNEHKNQQPFYIPAINILKEAIKKKIPFTTA